MLPQLNMSYHPYLYMQPSQFTCKFCNLYSFSILPSQ